VTTLRNLATLSLLLGIATCMPQVPEPMASFPQDVDVIKVEMSKEERDGWRVWGPDPVAWKGEHRPRITSPNGRAIQLDCHRSLLQYSHSCNVVKFECAHKEWAFDMTLPIGGEFTVQVDHGWVQSRPSIKMELKRIDDADLKLTSGAPGPLHAQWVEGPIDSKTYRVKASPVKHNSEVFNQLSVIDGGIYISVRQDHPQYDWVVASLSQIGSLWAANREHFAFCSTSRNLL